MKVDKFYFMKSKRSKEVLVVQLTRIDPMTVHYFRSLTDVSSEDVPLRKYVPVWITDTTGREDWGDKTEAEAIGFSEFTTMIKPKDLIPIQGFRLNERSIPQESHTEAKLWLKSNSLKYYNRVGGRSWIPLKADISHNGKLLIDPKKKKKASKRKRPTDEKEKNMKSSDSLSAEPTKKKQKKTKVKPSEEIITVRRSKRKKATVKLCQLKYVYLLKIKSEAKVMNPARLLKYQDTEL